MAFPELALIAFTVLAPAPEAVRIVAPSGAEIAAVFRDAGPGAPAVLLFPMCRADAMAGWTPVAERLLARGVSSLAVTYPGFGESRFGAPGNHRDADAGATVDWLRARVGRGRPLGVTGSSCGVYFAMETASRTPEVRAVVALTGPHMARHVAFVLKTPALSVFAGASLEEPPAPDWARELKQASAHSSSQIELLPQKAHGTDLFAVEPTLADRIAEWLAVRLKQP
jgi:dienelactone hydrolase